MAVIDCENDDNSEQNKTPVIDIPTKVSPTAVCITKNYGTVCIAKNKEIKTFSINGLFLKSAVIDDCDKITYMISCPFSSIDSIAISGKNKVYIIDSVLLNVMKVFNVCENDNKEIIVLSSSNNFNKSDCITY